MESWLGKAAIPALTVCTIYGIYKIKCRVDEYIESSKDSSLGRRNIIPIINKLADSIVDGALGKSDNTITFKTFVKFAKAYDKIDKDQDINVVILTPGGDLGAVEAIINIMMSHTGQGRFIAHIPFYAYSGGTALALACHEIRMLPRSVVGPCDGQIHINGVKGPTSTIIDAVDAKCERGENVSEKWIVARDMSIKCRIRQRSLIERLVNKGIMTTDTGERVFEELFSGKHNHDMSFSAQDLAVLGLNVNVVDSFPREITDLFEKIDQ